MSFTAPFNLSKWIDDHRHELKPPVGNKTIYKEAGNFIVMVVAGPNIRKDYHYNETEELFYQLEGDIWLNIINEEGKPEEVHIKEGEMFLLPGKVPHSPQRPANTVGLVIEKVRAEGDTDGFQWYCEKCNEKLFEKYFFLENIVHQLPPLMKEYYDSEEHRTCNKCNAIMEKP
jgi:3-hydroxyanthranilate 3,4-dioxygenase